jgi:bla regulator protein blaR1
MTLYLLKLSLCSGLLLLVYFLFLQSEKVYRFNRFFLLFSIVFSFVVPLITLTGSPAVIPFAESVAIVEESILPGSSTEVLPVEEQKESLSVSWLLLLWCTVSGGLLLRFLYNIVVLVRRRKGQEVVLYQGVKMVLVLNGILPYSFFNRIYVCRKEYVENRLEKEILQHEIAHVSQRHSLDILFLELITCFAWFNPFFYGYKKAIQLNHEFLADEAVLATYPDTNVYQRLVLSRVVLASRKALASSFYYVTTKKRLVMMLRNKAPFRSMAKQIALLPLLVILLVAFSTKGLAKQVTVTVQSTIPPIMAMPQDTTKFPVWVGEPVGSTKEGVSEALMAEYSRIVAKYKTPGDQFDRDSHKMVPEDKAQLEAIFRQMSPAQQATQEVAFLKPIRPRVGVKPTIKQVERFKNARVYGVWIDGKKVTNEVLNGYQASAFADVFISKLHGAAKKGRLYTHQVDLMTHAFYQEYNHRANKREGSVMVVRRVLRK